MKTTTGIVCAIALAALTSAAQAQLWQERASMPGPGRHHPVTFSLDGYGYVTTGSTSGASASDDFYRYDPVDDSWTVLPDFPGPDRGYAYGGTWGGKAYIGFGSTGGSYLADLWSYDPGTESWTQLSSCPGQPRTHPSFVITDDGKLYLSCGGSAVGNLKDLWVYDIGADSWTQKDDLPGARRHHPYYFNIGNTPYTMFGHGAGIFNDVYKFDPVADAWEQMADFPGEARVAGAQFSWNGKGYVISGDGQDHQLLEEGEFWEYDASDDSWTAYPSHPGSSRWAPGTFMIGNTVYLMAGLSSTGLQHDLWKFEMDGVVGVADASTVPALGTQLRPNPFRSHTVVTFSIESPQSIALDVFDAAGRSVRDLATGSWTSGQHQVTWDGKFDGGQSAPAGVYFIRLTGEYATASQRLVRLP